MKFENKYVWSKVNKYSQHAQFANMTLPEALKSAAVDIFMRENAYPRMNVPEYDKYVIHTAIAELNEKGYIEFGDVTEDWA